MIFYSKKTDDYGRYCKPEDNTKVYQDLWTKDILRRVTKPGMRVLEIGANVAFDNLRSCKGCELWVADPYEGLGAGSTTPPSVPDIIISRCAIGATSNALPSNFFDVIFSSSVLEHVGQAECQYDCHPVDLPPEVQEIPRRALCQEMTRILKTSGLSIHSIDHAVRNVTYMKNFLDAGLKLWQESAIPTIDQMIHDPDALTQTRDWHDPSKPLFEAWLHPVICSVFYKPC
jgi:hypothetical protein